VFLYIQSENVNLPPLANAGPDISLQLPVDSVIIAGKGEDPDGNVEIMYWQQFSGHEVLSGRYYNDSLVVHNLLPGIYGFRLTVLDNGEITVTDEMFLFVQQPININKMPQAYAGDDLLLSFPNIDTIIVGSYEDRDGYIVDSYWQQNSGPGIFFRINGDTINLKNLELGEYEFTYSVMDNDSAFATDDLRVIVASGNLDLIQPPKAFSPDGNAINDLWIIENHEILSGCPLIIFNRFGEKVYESNSYQNNWDGTRNGIPLPEADYYYVFTCKNGSRKTGGVRIIRKR
jgi:gliding motility-associated-like protein